MSATLLYGDCLDKMKALPDKSVDCFICDLPYGQLAPGQGGKLDSEKYGEKRVSMANTTCAWDIKIDLKAFWEQVERLAKNDHTPVIHFCNTKFGYELIKSKEKWFRYDIVWDKERGVSFLLANKMPMKSHEMIYIFSKKGAYYKRIDIKGEYKHTKRNGVCSGGNVYGISKDYHKNSRDTPSDERCALSVITIKKSNNGNSKEHPTEKPKELYEWLLKRYCPEGGTVLDPTAGSFNSIEVAKELGLKGIGIEKDRAFFWKAVSKF
jgi:site-specific DNA-methyltransferase (adenine-specific)